MIVGMLCNAERYRGLSKNLDIAFEWLSQMSWKSLPAGKYPIQDDAVFALVQEYTTKGHAACRFETHRKYIDIQMMIAGEEIIESTPSQDLKTAEPYVPDIEFYSTPADQRANTLAMIPECFAIFFPEDAHRPGMRIGDEPRNVRKLVIKVAL